MIIIRTPLRISIAGGGTDLPSYYSKFGSTFVSAAINKYIYITYHRSQFDSKIRLRYSRMEETNKIDEIQHEIIRETLKQLEIKDRVELTSHAEIPSGTGLGSSGSFGVGIIQAILAEQGIELSKDYLATLATYIQTNILNHPIGVQDQWVAAHGGMNIYKVGRIGLVSVSPLKIGMELDDKLALFFTGFKREANEILKTQKDNFLTLEESLHHTQRLCYDIIENLKNENFHRFGELMNQHWFYKKQRSLIMTNPQIDKWYKLALKNGAVGGKLVGAGGGGFLLFYTEDKERLIKAMPLQHIPFEFDYDGSKVLNE